MIAIALRVRQEGLAMSSSYFSLVIALIYLFAQRINGQNTTSTSTYSQSNVPTGTPVAGNYGGPLRPQVHFSPPKGFMNDPNGMFVDAAGLYHLYYQYNPTANVAGNQHWGHATSQDLYTWTNQPIALFPSNPTEGIFSGSTVLDPNNTSGFFPNRTNGVVAIYTLNTPSRQVQSIAYSLDNGYTFTKYPSNPVIPSSTNQFRDPKVFWHAPTRRWIMVVAYPVDFKIAIFTSQTLRSWTPASNFSHHGLLGLQYECPNLVQLRVAGRADPAWMLWISINPGAPLGGSITQYFVGAFNGTHFTADDARTTVSDFGKDNYAGQFFGGGGEGKGKGEGVSVAWASNWQYTNVVPTAGEGWRSVMSVPRANYLKQMPRTGLGLVSYPYDIWAVVEREVVFNKSLGNGSVFVDFSDVRSGALYFEANVTNLTDVASLEGALNFTVGASGSGESVSGGTFVESGDVWLDRGNTRGFMNPFFTDKFSATGVYDGEGTWRISGVVDRSIIEVFLNGGELSATSVFFPTQRMDWMSVSVRGINESAVASVGVWALKAAWLGEADANGTVVGNVTEG
ncbi:hypothetical protein EJ04DRAFT_472948, partial [Polyplosphaeria fusca]